MVAIVSGSGLGLFNTSLNILGSAGVVGQGWLGQAGGRSYVNAASGNLILQFQDELLSGRGADLLHLRTYNSLGKVAGQFTDGDGDGWRWDGEARLELTGTVNTNGSTVKRIAGDGNETTYAWDGTRYVTTDGNGAHDTLEYSSTAATDKRWTWTDGTTRLVEQYGTTAASNKWELRHRIDDTGNVIDYAYTSGRLSSVTDRSSGQWIELIYSGSPVRLTQVNTYTLLPDNTVGAAVKQVTYTYDAGRLKTVNTVLKPGDAASTSYTTTYNYEGATTRISSLTQSDGTRVDFTYDGSDRIASVTDANGRQTFTYNTNVVNNTTTTDVTIGEGANAQTWTYTYDVTTKQLVKIESPAPTAGAARLVTTFAYETNAADGAGHAGNVKTITQMIDATHTRTVTYGYDARGNRTLERDSLGNTLTRTFDDQNQVLSETRYKSADTTPGDGAPPADAMTTRFAYDSQARLRFVVTAEGRVSESRYNSNGLLERTVVYTADRYSATAFGESDLASWVANSLADKSQIQLTQLTYDFRGNLDKRTDFAKADANGAGVLDAAATVTEHVYDAHGRLLKTIAVRGSARDQRTELTSFLYDGLGRETTRITSNGTQTTLYNGVDYTGGANTIQVTTGTGANTLTVLSTFDSTGRLTSLSRSDSSTTRQTTYLYDAQGRLRMSEDAQGGRMFTFYNAAGQLVYQVDRVGSVTGFTYNGAGQLLAETHYNQQISNTDAWLDTTTTPPQVVKLTLVVADAAGTGVDLVRDAAKDRSSSLTYDDAGRLQSRTDVVASGATSITTLSYDGASRLTQQKVTDTQTNQDRITRYFYDADGLQVGVIDPLGYLTETKYDAARRVVETIRYATRSLNAPDAAAPIFIGVTTQTAVAGKPFSYNLYATDADGDSLTFSKVNPNAWPSWLTLDTSVPGAPVLKGTPPATLTTYSVTVAANDGRGKSSQATVQIVVANTAPNWPALDDIAAIDKAAFSYTLPEATDNEGGALTYSIVGGNAALPPGLTFTGRTISGTPTTPGTYVVTARVSDSGSPPLSTERTFVMQIGNRAPVWNVTPTPPAAVRTQAFSYALPAGSDPEAQALTYRIVSGPSWLTISGTTLSGTPPFDPNWIGEHVVKLEVEDTFHESTPLVFVLKIVNRAPTWVALPAIDNAAGEFVDFTPPAPVDPEGDAISFSYRLLTELPSGLNFDPATGRIWGQTSAAQVGDFSLMLIAQDNIREDARGVTEQRLDIRLRNTPPAYSHGITDLSGYWNNWIRLPIPDGAFSDINGDTVTLSVLGAQPGFPPDALTSSGMFFQPTSGGGGFLNYRDTAAGDAGGATKFFIIRATDSRGGFTDKVIQITVNPLPPPPPPPPPPPAPPPSPPGWPPRHPQAHAPGGGESVLAPLAPIEPAPQPVLGPAPEPAKPIGLAPAPLELQAIAPIDDVLSTLRPAASANDLHTYLFYDGQGRVTGAVDEQSFLSETVYDAAANTLQNLRYKTKVTVDPTDTLDVLRGEAGAALVTTTQFDAMGRVSTVKREFDGIITRNEYDDLGRLVRTVSADGTADARGNRIQYNLFNEVTGTVGGVGDAWLAANTDKTLADAIKLYGTRFEYDTLGRAVKTILANGVDDQGNASRSYYDREGRLTHTLNANGEATEIQYNAFGQVQDTRAYGTRLDVAGDVFKGLMDGTKTRADLDVELDRILANSKDRASAFEYDQRGLTTKVTDALQFVTTHSYTGFGQLQQQIRTIVKGNTPVTTATQFDYDLVGRLLSQTGDVGGSNFNTRTFYDAFGRVTKTLDPIGRATLTAYKNGGRLIEVTDPLNRKVSTEIDTLGRISKVTDARGQATTYVFDEAQRKTTMTTPEGVKIVTVLTPQGETKTVTDGRNKSTSYTYDKDGHLLTVTDELGHLVQQNQYDKAGRLEQTTDARGTVTRFSYDAVNRMFKRQVDPAGLNLTTTYTFDAFGQQISVTEGVGSNGLRLTSYKYDLQGRLAQIVVDPNGLKLATTFSYDGLGNKIQVARGTTAAPNQLVTQYVLDKLGRVVQEIVAPSAVVGTGSAKARNLTTTHVYDTAGRVTRSIDANGQSTWFVYDAADQLTHTVNPLGEVSQRFYDANGDIVQTRQYLNTVDVSSFGDTITASQATPTASQEDRRSYIVYDNDRRQRFTLVAEGKQVMPDSTVVYLWSVGETRYDANNNVIETRRYDKFLDEVRVTAIEPSGVTLAEAKAELRTLGYQEKELGSTTTDAATLANVQRTRLAYDAANRLRFSVDAVGGVSESIYDDAGNVIRSVRYATAVSPSAFDEATLDAAVDRANAANQVTNYAFDRGGRVRFVSKQLAAAVGTTPAKALVTEHVYDGLGRVLQTIRYAKETTIAVNYNDVAAMPGALQANSEDRISASVFDAAGRQIYAVQSLTVTANRASMQHIVRKMEYDALGNAVKSTAYADVLPLANFNRATLDAAVAASGVADDPGNRVTRFAYDKANRLRFTVAADGSFNEMVYDALGRVTETRKFAVTVTPSTPITEDALVARRGMRRVGDAFTRGEKYTYDKAGRRLTTTDAALKTDISTYDALGNRVTYIDKNGVDLLNQHAGDNPPFDRTKVTWSYTYDRMGRRIDEISPQADFLLSSETTLPAQARRLTSRNTYDVFGNLVAIADAFGTDDARVTQFGYDKLNRQTLVILPGYYDPSLGKVEKADATGRFQRTLETKYDALGNVVRTKLRTGASSYQYEYKTYDTLGRVVHDIDALGDVTAFSYNSFDQQLTVKRFDKTVAAAAPGGAEAVWSAAAVNAALGSDPKARQIDIAYDNVGRKSTVTSATVASHYYSSTDAVANAGSITPVSAAGVTRYDYNAFGDVVHEAVKVDSLGTGNFNGPGHWQDTWRYFDAVGRETVTVDALGFQTARSYDALGNLRQVTEFANAGAAGALDNRTPPLAPPKSDADRRTMFAYDVLNQRIIIRRLGIAYSDASGVQTRGDVTISSVTHDSNGNLRTQTDALGNVTTTEYDALGQVTQITEPARLTAGSGVDPFLSMRTGSPVTRLTRNAFGNVVTTERTAGGGAGDTIKTREEYDHAGNAVKSIDARSNEKTRKFDFAGRVIEERQDINVTLSGWLTNTHTRKRLFEYDARGKQTAVLDVYLDGATEMKSGQRSLFNAFGDVVEEWRVWGTSATALDSLSHAKTATYGYDNAGHVTSKSAGDGDTRYFYDLAGRVTRQEQRGDGAAGTVWRVTETGYNAIGQAVIQRLPAFSAAFENGADGMNLFYSTPFTEQTFDRWGNALSRRVGGYVSGGVANTSQRVTMTYAYNHDNQLIAETWPAATAVRADGSSYTAAVTHELRYDKLGRLVQERQLADDVATAGNEALELQKRNREYNAAGQLTAQIDGTSIRTEYVYDANGNRVGTKNNIGTVFVDTFDQNGNQLTHGVLRQTSAEDSPAYFSGGGSAVRRVLNTYTYDQANNRVESTDVMNAAGTVVHRSFTKLDERNQVRGQRTATGIVTLLDYDQFGNKTREQVGSAFLGNIQTWTYSSADDYTVGRMLTATGGSSSTTYEYNGFGQVKREVYGNNNERRYTYHDNGLLKKIEDNFTKGTAGSVGGVDYLSTTEITEYDYSVKGELVQEHITRTGSQDVLEREREGGITREFIFSRALPSLNRTTFTRYDALGRMARVWAPGTLSSLDYSYDELGNVRHITAPGTDNWFTYDAEGRMTLADGVLDGGVIGGGTKIEYDALGRRWQTEVFHKSNSWVDPDRIGDPDEIFYSWTEYRLEQYEYNDLGYLQKIWQQLDFRDAYETTISGTFPGTHDGATGWYLLEDRKTDVRGATVNRDTYEILNTQDNAPPQTWDAPARRFLTSSSYDGDGRLTSQQTLESGNANFNEVLTEFVYNDDGTLASYKYINGVGPRAYIDTFGYTYGMEFGGRKEQTVGVSRVAHEDAEPGAHPGTTTTYYDARGRIAKTVVSNVQRTTTRSFIYDSQGHALAVDERASSVTDGIRTGSQAHFYANGRQVGTIGSDSLAGSRFSFAFTPITEQPNSPSSYTVRSGDSLSSIAQAVYGDGALWYLIADANNVNFSPNQELPSTELAKAYRIPNVTRSHNNANTFKPYSAAEIIGNTTPSPAIPIPPEQCTGVGRVVATVVVTAITIVVQVVVTAVLTEFVGPQVAGAIGAASGNLAGQVTGWGLGLQDGIDWGEVGEAGIAGFAGGVAASAAPGSSTSAALARTGGSFVGGQVAHQLVNRSDREQFSIGGTLFSLGTQLGAAALGKSLQIDNTYFDFGSAAGQMTNNAFNPQTGWVFNERMRDWSTIASQAASALTSVAVNAGVDWHYAQMAWKEHEEAVRAGNARRAAQRGVTSVNYQFLGDGQAIDANKQWEIDGWKQLVGIPVGENEIARRARIGANQQFVDEYNAQTTDPDARIGLDENGDIISNPTGFIKMRMGDDELELWLRARDVRQSPLQPRTIDRIRSLQERIQQDSFDLATGQVSKANAAWVQEQIDRNQRLVDHLTQKVLPGEIEQARHDIREHRRAEVERTEQIAEITGRTFDEVLHKRKQGFAVSAVKGAAEFPLRVVDSVRLAADGDARPWSQYGQQIKIAANVYGLDPWEEIVPMGIAGSVPVAGQALGLAQLGSSIANGEFDLDAAGSLFGSVAAGYLSGRLLLGSGLVKMSGPTTFGSLLRGGAEVGEDLPSVVMFKRTRAGHARAWDTGTGNRNDRALNLVDHAAKASGLSGLDELIGGLVDEVFYGGPGESAFGVFPGTQVRYLRIGGDTFAKAPAGQLIDGIHEIGHAQSFAKRVRAKGFDAARNEYGPGNPREYGTPLYAREEQVVERLARWRADKYLGGLSPQQAAASRSYAAFWRAVETGEINIGP